MSSALSQRGRQLVEHPPFAPYLLEHFARGGEAWEPATRPDGYIALCVAENRSMWDELLAQLVCYRDVPGRALGYDAMIGNLEFRTKLAGFLSRELLGRDVGAEQLAVVAGAGSVLELLFYAIADEGDAVLVPTPSYAGFWADLETRDKLHIIPVASSADSGFRVTPDDLDRALASAERPVKALLFTSPDNPLGRVYTADELEAILAWGERTGVHVVFDEIYGLSVFGERPFVSVASLRPSLGERVHVVWAFSKDFGASGLRCGVLVSDNPEVLQAVDGLAYWAAVSGDTQWLLGELVADTSFIPGYLARMRARLGSLYGLVTAALGEAGVPFVAADGGIFVLCDLRAWLDEPSWAGEDRLWRRIVDEANVNLTPGSACRIAEPGFFRLCYAAESRAAVREGVRRLAALLAG